MQVSAERSPAQDQVREAENMPLQHRSPAYRSPAVWPTRWQGDSPARLLWRGGTCPKNPTPMRLTGLTASHFHLWPPAEQAVPEHVRHLMPLRRSPGEIDWLV